MFLESEGREQDLVDLFLRKGITIEAGVKLLDLLLHIEIPERRG